MLMVVRLCLLERDGQTDDQMKGERGRVETERWTGRWRGERDGRIETERQADR